MKKVDADKLRSNEDFRQKIGSEAEKLVRRIKNVENHTLKRRLDI